MLETTLKHSNKHHNSRSDALSPDWWTPTSAVDLIGCYFTVGGGALRVNISEDEASQIDVCLVHINLKLHCRLQQRRVGEKRRRRRRRSVEGRRRRRRRKFLVLNP